MRENGAKLMKLYIGSLGFKDCRQGSFLKNNKNIVYNFEKHIFKIEEDE